jgi:uncharacterized protein YbjT (DUF2867 family)
MTKIAVAGATGRIGRPIAELLEAGGHEVVPIARSLGVDVVTGEGLAEALDGVEVIVDAATGPSPDEQQATDFFTASTRNLLQAGADARKIVMVSIIGIDRISSGYQAAKVAQEEAYRNGPIPVRIVRVSQFHEFIGVMTGWARQGDVSHLPEMLTQPVLAAAAGEKIAELAASDDDGPEIVEIAGPRVERLAALAKLVAERSGDGLRVQEVSDPSPDGARIATGAMLPGPGATLVGPTFEEWLRSYVPDMTLSAS